MYSVTLIPGDGVGKEITNSVKDIFEKANVPVEFEEFPGVSGESGPDDTEFRKSMDSLRRNKVGLKGESSDRALPLGSARLWLPFGSLFRECGCFHQEAHLGSMLPLGSMLERSFRQGAFSLVKTRRLQEAIYSADHSSTLSNADRVTLYDSVSI